MVKTLDKVATLDQVNTIIASDINLQGNYNASTNTPDLDTAPTGISKGWHYVVDVAGTFFTVALEVGDSIIAKQDNPTVLGDWILVQTNLTAASIKTQYESNANTNEYDDAEQTKLAGIEALADVTDLANVNAALATSLGTVTVGIWNGTPIATAFLADNSVTLAKMAGGIDGNIISYDLNGDPVAIVTGTVGQVLTSAGAGAQPAFETLSVTNAELAGSITAANLVGTDIATVGTITTGTWQGDVVASAFLDADTMHLSVAQSVSGAKTFQDNGIIIESPDTLTPVTLLNAQQTLARNLTIPILIANDTIVTLGTAQTISGAKTFGATIEMSGNIINKPTLNDVVSIGFDAGTPAAAAGLVRFGNAEVGALSWRNAANSADIILTVDANDRFVPTSDLERAGGVKLSTLGKQFVDYFSGDSLSTAWTFVQNNGSSNVLAMLDGIGEGIRITTEAGTSRRSVIWFDDIKHFDAASSTIYGVCKYQNATQVVQVGICDAVDVELSATELITCVNASASTFVALRSSDGTASDTASDVTLSANPVTFKIINNATNMRLFILESGAWALKVTKTSNKPASQAMSPVFGNRTTAAAAVTADLMYLKVQND